MQAQHSWGHERNDQSTHDLSPDGGDDKAIPVFQASAWQQSWGGSPAPGVQQHMIRLSFCICETSLLDELQEVIEAQFAVTISVGLFDHLLYFFVCDLLTEVAHDVL